MWRYFIQPSGKRGNVAILLTTQSHFTLMAGSLQWPGQSDHSICISMPSRILLKLHGDTELAKAWTASKENLHFDNQSKQVVCLFLVARFSKGNKKCSRCFCRVIATLIKVWEKSKKLWNTRLSLRVPTAFFHLPNFHSCF